MATRGTIAVVHKNGTVSQVYAHWDNYLSGTGQTLMDHYNSQELAESLVTVGDISSVGNTVETTEYYGRDRGEDEVEARVFTDLDGYYSGLQTQEYNYLFANGEWLVEYDDSDGEYVSLQQALLEEAN